MAVDGFFCGTNAMFVQGFARQTPINVLLDLVLPFRLAIAS